MNYEQKYLKYKQKYLNLKNQMGGSFYFAVYLFSKAEVNAAENAAVLAVLNSLYGGSASTITVNEANWDNNSENLFQIKDFVYEKGADYKAKQNIIIYKIGTPPAALIKAPMTDGKLTHEEYAIRDALTAAGINNITLVSAQHGLWAEGVALIGLHKL
jgi:hypothetical protein